MADLTLTDVPGVGSKTSDRLMALGIDTVASLEAAPIELLSTLPGFHPSRSRAVKEAAGGLLASTKTSAMTSQPSGASADGTAEAKKSRPTGKKKKKTASKHTTTKAQKKKKKKSDTKKKNGDGTAKTTKSKSPTSSDTKKKSGKRKKAKKKNKKKKK